MSIMYGASGCSLAYKLRDKLAYLSQHRPQTAEGALLGEQLYGRIGTGGGSGCGGGTSIV
jgi:hypothetical protein